MLAGRTSNMNPKGLSFPSAPQSPNLTKRPIYEDRDQEKFILEVKKRECIWNNKFKFHNRLNSYRSREVRRRAWEEIARIHNPNWNELNQEQRQKKVETLTRRWANIRKYYVDELRRPSDSPARKKQRRVYHNLLTFLDDIHYKRRATKPSNEVKTAPEDTHDTTSDSDSNELRIIEDVNELAKLSHNYAPIPEFYRHTNPDPKSFEYQEPVKPWQMWDAPLDLAMASVERTSDMTARNPEIMRLLNDNGPRFPDTSVTRVTPVNCMSSNIHDTSTLDVNTDACRQFLLSLVPEIMSLNVKQNLQFRLGMLDLLNDIKFSVNSDDQ